MPPPELYGSSIIDELHIFIRTRFSFARIQFKIIYDRCSNKDIKALTTNALSSAKWGDIADPNLQYGSINDNRKVINFFFFISNLKKQL